MGVSENRGPKYSTLNSRILVIRTPKSSTPNFRKLSYPTQKFLFGSFFGTLRLGPGLGD